MAVTLHGGVAGDTSTIEKTLDAADENLKKARETGDKSKTRESAEESVGDKGYLQQTRARGPGSGRPSQLHLRADA